MSYTSPAPQSLSTLHRPTLLGTTPLFRLLTCLVQHLLQSLRHLSPPGARGMAQWQKALQCARPFLPSAIKGPSNQNLCSSTTVSQSMLDLPHCLHFSFQRVDDTFGNRRPRERGVKCKRHRWMQLHIPIRAIGSVKSLLPRQEQGPFLVLLEHLHS